MEYASIGIANTALSNTKGIIVGGAPYIQGGYWYVWDKTTSNYVKSVLAEGVNGSDGRGIKNLILVSESAEKNVYRIIFTDDTTFEYDVLNGKNGTNGNDGTNGSDGRGITSLDFVETVGLVDLYRITFTDGTTFDYSVTNGKDGSGSGGKEYKADGTTLTLNDVTFSIKQSVLDSIATATSKADAADTKATTATSKATTATSKADAADTKVTSLQQTVASLSTELEQSYPTTETVSQMITTAITGALEASY